MNIKIFFKRNKFDVVSGGLEVKGDRFALSALVYTFVEIEKIRVFAGKGKNKGPEFDVRLTPTSRPAGIKKAKKKGNRVYRMQITGDGRHTRHIRRLDHMRLFMQVYIKGKQVHKVLTFKEIAKTLTIRAARDNRGAGWGFSRVQYFDNHVFRVQGWCYSETKVDNARIFINNKYRGKIKVDLPRLDIYDEYDDCLDQDCGFEFAKRLRPGETIRLLMKFFSGDRLVFIVSQEFEAEKIRLDRKSDHTRRSATAAKPTPPLQGTPPLEGISREHVERSTSTFPSYGGVAAKRAGWVRTFAKKQDKAPAVLIYCADITGHRHLYSAYFIQYFLDRKYEVYFCYAGRFARALPNGIKSYSKSESPYLDVFKENPRVHLLNIHDELDGIKNELNFIIKLQEQLEPELSLFIDGDILKYTFWRQMLPWQKRLSGANFSHNCFSEFIYFPVVKFQALKEWFSFIYCHFFDRAVFFDRVEFVERFPLLNTLFFRCLCRFNLLSAAFFPDVRLVNRFKHERILFLPELAAGNREVKLAEKESSFYTRIKSRYQDFLKKNRGKLVLLLFGDLESRKGYDLLLRLAAHDPGCVCVRFGRTKGGYTPTWEATISKEQLLLEDRLFEVDTYVKSRELIDFIFSTVNFMILPYRNYYRTSGVLTDVLRRGLPVLTSDKGVMAYIVKYYRVGRVFRDGHFPELQRIFAEFKQNYEGYLENIEKFKSTCSEKKIEEILAVMLENKKK